MYGSLMISQCDTDVIVVARSGSIKAGTWERIEDAQVRKSLVTRD